MHIDWLTWGLWLLGLIILIVWIYLPAKEIKKIVLKMQRRKQ